jgi:hypothetical protein
MNPARTTSQILTPAYPVFVLGGIIVEKEYAEGELAQKLTN